MIRNRYAGISTAYVDAVHRQQERTQKETQAAGAGTSRPVTPEEWEEMQRTATLGTRLHLEIESFYVFANILLDRIAATCLFYFSRKSKWNHWQLTANLENFCKKRGLVVPSANLLKMPAQLQDLIVKYRNTRIEHVEEPRLIHGTSLGPDKKAKILPAILYPTQEEMEKIGEIQRPSADLDEILASLDTYMTAMLNFFDGNADKSILMPKRS